jgi:hypothetical protein
VEPGRFELQVGASSEDVRAEGSFEIVGEVRELDSSEIVATRTSLLSDSPTEAVVVRPTL